jgi:hypothetical protein
MLISNIVSQQRLLGMGKCVFVIFRLIYSLLDLVVRGRSVGENDRDASTGFTVCFEEATLPVVDNDVTTSGRFTVWIGQ